MATYTYSLDHEKNGRWAAVDHYVWDQLYPSSSPLSDSLAAALAYQHASGLPDIAVSPLQGSFLQLQIQLLGSKRVLEVGTLGGYSTIWLAGAGKDVKVTTVDIQEHHTRVARESVTKAGLQEQVEFITAPGQEGLATLVQEVKTGKRVKYDFVFIDADKVGSWDYVQLALEMTVKGACIIVDNVVRRGNVASAQVAKTDANVAGSRKVIEEVAKDKMLQATVIQTGGEKNYDGMLICRVV